MSVIFYSNQLILITLFNQVLVAISTKNFRIYTRPRDLLYPAVPFYRKNTNRASYKVSVAFLRHHYPAT